MFFADLYQRTHVQNLDGYLLKFRLFSYHVVCDPPIVIQFEIGFI